MKFFAEVSDMRFIFIGLSCFFVVFLMIYANFFVFKEYSDERVESSKLLHTFYETKLGSHIAIITLCLAVVCGFAGAYLTEQHKSSVNLKGAVITGIDSDSLHYTKNGKKYSVSLDKLGNFSFDLSGNLSQKGDTWTNK
jgi:hypothetical protein